MKKLFARTTSLVAGMVMVLAPVGAQAATPPSAGPLLNAAGQANGCTGGTFLYQSAGDPTTLNRIIDGSCPASAGMHILRYSSSLYVVNPDGTWRQKQAYTYEGGTRSMVTPLDTTTVSARSFACDEPGTHTWVTRGYIEAKAAPGSASYLILTQSKKTFTCP